MDTTTEDVSAHMYRVQQAERDLRELGAVWRTIESAAAISCPEEVAPILPTLVGTRERFEALQQRLIEEMVVESRAALGDELTAKAQCAIDILVRNLYERTADVGFLATDDAVRQFCALPLADREAQRGAMAERLRAYQAKYTVYDDVVLLDLQGRILARLDTACTAEESTDPLLAQAASAPGYVERYGPTDLQRQGQPALLYGHRIDSPTGTPLGVLVLRFRFDDEMERIFDGVADARREMAIVLLGPDQRVVASLDTAHVPVGARLAPVPPGHVSLTSFAGREYLAVCCETHGYQGYAGPGWRAQAMVSLLTAFRDRDHQANNQAAADQEIALDHEALQAINRDAEAINRDLRRVVWNGRLMAGGRHGNRLRLKAVLGQVNAASVRTRQRVGLAIRDLARTALARSRRHCRDMARLAADIMDRNLYERANDCRWWALSPAVQQALQAGEAADPQSLNAVLDHVNSLYTVYSRLVVFDAAGTVRGASRAAGSSGLVGHPVDARWLSAVKGLDSPQRYAVSDFEDTPLHDGGPTYTYLAAVRHPRDNTLLGGVAIVFHAARELRAMLRDVLGDRPGLAAYVDAQGRVLAATDPMLAGEARLQFTGDVALFDLAGAHHVAARIEAGGYREFKCSDGYANQVSAVVALRLGTAGAIAPERIEFEPQHLRPAGQQPMEVAIFQVGPLCCGLLAEHVLEAASPKGLVPLPGRGGASLGLLEVNDANGQSTLVHVWCAQRLLGLVEVPAPADGGMVIVLGDPDRPGRPALGLRVSDVLSVAEFDAAGLHTVPTGTAGFTPWVSGLLELPSGPAQAGSPALVQLLDAGRLLAPAGVAEGVPDGASAQPPERMACSSAER
jgi:chemotaxis signal transduction protein